MVFKTRNQPKVTQNGQYSESTPRKCVDKINTSTEMVELSKRKQFNKKRCLLISFLAVVIVFVFVRFICTNQQISPVCSSSYAQEINFLFNKYISNLRAFQNCNMGLNKFFDWAFLRVTLGKIDDLLKNICLISRKLGIIIFGKLSLTFIWAKYMVNTCISIVKFEYKRLSRKYEMVMLTQTVIVQIYGIVNEKMLNLIQCIQFFFISSSNYTFYFTTISIIVINVIIWENIIMKNMVEDYRLNNLKIVTSTVSSLLTVFYLSSLEKLASQLIGKYYNYVYGFCSRAFLQSDDGSNSEFGYHEMKEFTFISNDWWRINKFESVFKGVEIINEIKKRTQPQVVNETVVGKFGLFGSELVSRFKYNGQITKDVCNCLINGNQEMRIIFRSLSFFTSITIVTCILYFENKRINESKNIGYHSKMYTFFTVISGLIVPILLNNIQKFSTYKEQGRVIFILLFLSLKLITNHKHFLILIFELTHNIKSRFNTENNFGRIFLQNQDQVLCAEEIKVNENGLSQTGESSSLVRERNKRASVLRKNTKSSHSNSSIGDGKSTKSEKKCSTQRKQQSLSKDLNKNKVKYLNDIIRTKITSKNGMQEMFDHSLNAQSDQEKTSESQQLFIILSKIMRMFKYLLTFVKDMAFFVFVEKVFGYVLYIFFKDYRGFVLSSFDHYRLNKYIQEGTVPMNLKEELLKSMTLCYTNIGNPQIIKSINLAKKELIQDLEDFKLVLPNMFVMEKLKSIQETTSLSQLEIILQPFSGIKSLEEKINTEIQYYMILNSIDVLSVNCEIIKESCKAVINSESLIELINNITNHDLEKINLLLNSNIDYTTISNIIKSVILMNENRISIWNRFSLITNSMSKVNLELVGKLNELKGVDIDEIFIQWNILRAGLKYVLNQIKNNRKSYEDIYMGGLPLHTLQMALHYLNNKAKKTSDLVQESIVACSEFCLYFNLKTIEELYELNKSSTGQSKLFELCKKDCNDILSLIQTIRYVLEELCEDKIRIDGKEIDISYLSSMLPAVVLNSEHKCCRKETEFNCKLHGKGLQDTFRLYAEGNFPAVSNNCQFVVNSKRESSKFVPERPRSSIPREPSNQNKEFNAAAVSCGEEKSHASHNINSESIVSNQTGLRLPKEVNMATAENLPFLISTPEESIK